DVSEDQGLRAMAGGRSLLSRRALLARLGLAGAGLAFGGGLAGTAEGEPQRASASTTFRIGQAPSTIPIGPAVSINDALLMLTGDGKVIPWLAESWSQPSARRMVFTIHRGVKFWDGSPLKMADIVYSY